MSQFNPTPKSENPYAAPISAQAYNPGGQYGPAPYPPHDSFPNQVPVIGILMIVQGVLELLLGLVMFGVAGYFPFLMAMNPGMGQGPGQGPGPPPVWIISIVYVVFGLGMSIPGILRIYAGYNVYRFRRRIFAIVANCLGFVTLITCYCAPTAIALGVYSLIVLLQPSVVYAFAQNAAAQNTKSGLK
ncbi:MAG: hypothetical protein Q8M16_03005 [Pirellulaceae bacterium]|nr:hypothetical protein [Pirellulaceae bacterium]